MVCVLELGGVGSSFDAFNGVLASVHLSWLLWIQKNGSLSSQLSHSMSNLLLQQNIIRLNQRAIKFLKKKKKMHKLNGNFVILYSEVMIFTRDNEKSDA